MSPSFYDLAESGLPNFPRPVIKLWFEHVESAGWPPRFDRYGLAVGIWRTRVFGDRTLAFWQSVAWQQGLLALAPALLEPTTGQLVNNAVMSYAMGLPPTPGFTTNDYRARIQNFLAILQATRRLPHPPILLRVGPLFEVLDGTHRLAALFVAQATGIPVDPTHEVWVASRR